MENKMMMPAYCTIMTEEEMTYTEGGATQAQAICSIIPFYGWYKGITAARAYKKAHPNDWIETGMSALTADMEKSTTNMIYDVMCTFWTVSATFSIVGAVINAAVLLS